MTTASRVLFVGHVGVAYGQVYVESGVDPDADMDATFRGQAQGLCGAAVPGALFLMTGLHTGHVDFRVELHDTEPIMDLGFEEIVEVSFRPVTTKIAIVEWSAQATHALALQAIDYRVRYSARGMDAGREADTILENEPTVDSYRLDLWPGPPAPEQRIKETSDAARYWNDYARKL